MPSLHEKISEFGAKEVKLCLFNVFSFPILLQLLLSDCKIDFTEPLQAQPKT